MPARRTPKPARTVEIGMRVYLTAAEAQKLRERAAADLGSVASFAGWLVAQALERPHDPRRAVVGVSPRDRRTPRSLTVRLSASQRRELQGRAQAELRSVSAYVARVIVEALAARRIDR